MSPSLYSMEMHQHCNAHKDWSQIRDLDTQQVKLAFSTSRIFPKCMDNIAQFIFLGFSASVIAHSLDSWHPRNISFIKTSEHLDASNPTTSWCGPFRIPAQGIIHMAGHTPSTCPHSLSQMISPHQGQHCNLQWLLPPQGVSSWCGSTKASVVAMNDQDSTRQTLFACAISNSEVM